MKMSKRKLISLMFILPLMMTGDTLYSSQASQGPPDTQRIRFQIATIEERRGARNTISLSTVEGPPGTDFIVNLEGARFKMNARFLTDVVAPGVLEVRTTLDTRRLYGYSERNLPLFEQDTQHENLQLGLDERIVLLPFGRNGGEDNLRVEITPTLSAETTRLPSGNLRPLEIKIPQPSPGGVIRVRASRTPHRFNIEATLVADGREIARGSSDYLIEETHELALHPIVPAGASGAPPQLVLNLTLSNYARSRPADEVQLDFDIHHLGQSPDSQDTVVLKGEGITTLGTPLSYDLNKTFLSGTGRTYELRFKVSLAPGADSN
jgi:hypothetical protein